MQFILYIVCTLLCIQAVCPSYVFLIFAVAVDCEWRYSNYSECVDERQFIFPIILMYPKYGGLPCPRFVSEGQPVSRLCYDANITGKISCFLKEEQ